MESEKSAKIVGAAGRAAGYRGGLNRYLVIVALLAAQAGGLMGFDIGVTGGVCSMNSFLEQFFPSVYESKQASQASPEANDPYCTFDDQTLALFTSSLFLAAMVVVLLAGGVTRAWGRRLSMLLGGTSFLIGGILNAAAQNLGMLYAGRMFLGIGVGFAAQSAPLYLSEMAPPAHRGAINMLFQLATTIGILAAQPTSCSLTCLACYRPSLHVDSSERHASKSPDGYFVKHNVLQLINYGIRDLSWGWRLSLGLAIVPALGLTLGALWLPDSPNSLIERGRLELGRAVLERIRGTAEVDAEYDDICEAAQQSRSFSQAAAWVLLARREYRPAAVLSTCVPAFMQLTGINAIMFYVPILFSSLGSGDSAALLNAVVIGVVNVLSTFVAIALVDRTGRRVLYLEGGVQMLLAQAVTAVLLGVYFDRYNTATLPEGVALGVLIVICVFVAGFAWSWGPLGLLSASEVTPLPARSAGLALGLSINFFLSFCLGQWFLSMLCAMEWGAFLFFAGFVIIMTVFIFFLLPETKGVPIEEIFTVYARHPVWSRVVGASGQAALELDAARSASMQFATSASKAEAAMGLEDPGDGNGKAGAAPIQAFT